MDSVSVVYIVVALIYNVYSILTAVGLYYYRNTEYMKHRNIRNCAAFIAANLYFGNFLILSIPYFQPLQSQIDCNISFKSMYLLFSPTWLFTFVFSVGNLVYKDRINQRRIQLMSAEAFDTIKLSTFEKVILWISKIIWKSKIWKGNKGLSSSAKLSTSNLEKTSRGNIQNIVESIKSAPPDIELMKEPQKASREDMTNTKEERNSPLALISQLNGDVSNSVFYFLHGVFLVVGILMMTITELAYGVHDCGTDQFIPMYIIAWGLLISITYLLYLAWYAQDNYDIRRNIFIHVLVLYPTFIMFGIAFFSSLFDPMNQILGINFSTLIMNLSGQLTTVTLPLLHCFFESGKTNIAQAAKGSTISLTGSSAALATKKEWKALEKIFSDPVEYEKFKKIIAADFCTENIIFYERYQKALKSNSDKKVQKLYVDFMLPGSRYELNLPAPLIESVKVANSEKKMTMETLVGVYDEVMNMMYSNTYQRYIKMKK